MTVLQEIKTWNSVRIGNICCAKAADKQLGISGIRITHRAYYLLEQAAFEGIDATLDLVRVTVQELGLKDGATTAEIHAVAARNGLSLCPAEVAPQLWLQHPSLMSWNKGSFIAMELIEDSEGNPSLLYLLAHCVTGRKLIAIRGGPDQIWNDSDHWVFVRK